MPAEEPVTELDTRYSEDAAPPTPWAVACEVLAGAEVFWLSTVRPDGRPHVTPLIAVWLDGALYFSTGPTERKARNLAGNRHCVLTTGSNALGHGLDLVVEGEAVRVEDDVRLQRVADAYAAKYGADWTYSVRDGAFVGLGGVAWVFAVAPGTAFGFSKGLYGQTRWSFPADG